jgi:hypothetical protein
MKKLIAIATTIAITGCSLASPVKAEEKMSEYDVAINAICYLRTQVSSFKMNFARLKLDFAVQSSQNLDRGWVSWQK